MKFPHEILVMDLQNCLHAVKVEEVEDELFHAVFLKYFNCNPSMDK